MKKYSILTIFLLLAPLASTAQSSSSFLLVYPAHPRYLAGNTDKKYFQNLLVSDESARTVFEQSRRSVDEYVNRCQTDSAWMLSRLQMYWKTRSTDVFIKGGVYDHAEGEAPVPTVRFPGTRDNVTVYTAPKLEDIQPYMDDPRGIYLVNRSKEGQPMEWAEISKTGRIIESINTQIMGLAYTAAVLYWINGEEKYGKFAFDLFNTYMTGMYYRKEPFDLTHGHHQTLGGLSTFEVIQETAMLNNLTGIYDYLYDYLRTKAPGKMNVYTTVFKKWADLQIAHGVAFNNWNLMEARNTLNIALVLDDDNAYADKKGNQYYTNYIVNKSEERQWSLRKIVNEGYDSLTGLWYECPGYSAGVLNDFVGYIGFFDKYYNYDLLEQMPVLKKAVLGMAQYQFPNGYNSSFGDSHYGRLNLNAAYLLVANARKNKKPQQELVYTRYIKTIRQFYKQNGSGDPERGEGQRNVRAINEVLYRENNIVLDEKISSGDISEYVTPVLYSSHVSFLALRNGFTKQNGLMAAMSGSKGNHMHAGGISMELYGKGYVMAPESGIGTSYFQPDYAEYYSQFPAHNTVAVDGISAYPVMKSNHGFELKNSYPLSGVSKDFFKPVSFANLYFLEPETNADQLRLTSIVRTSDSTGYYVDIFRSRRKDGKDKMHDYFYHDMGQQLLLSDNSGNALPLQTTEKLSFGGGHLFAYDYLYDKKMLQTDKDINAVFRLSVPGQEEVQMNMWMKGEKQREIFAVKAPKSTAIDRMGLPKEIAELPLPTIVARQSGEAWSKPFVAVFEPSSESQPKSVSSVQSFSPEIPVTEFTGIVVKSKTGHTQYIYSSADTSKEIKYKGQAFIGTYAVISELNGSLDYLFLGNGKKISASGYSIHAMKTGLSATLEKNNGKWYYSASEKIKLTVPVEILKGKNSLHIRNSGRSVIIAGRQKKNGNINTLEFDLPPASYIQIEF